jgi:transposase
MEALLLKSQGYSHNEILVIVGIGGRATLARYFKEYLEGGLDLVRQLKFRKPESPLAPHRDAIEKAIADDPPATVKEARALIARITGITLSMTAVHKFLKKTLDSPVTRPDQFLPPRSIRVTTRSRMTF